MNNSLRFKKVLFIITSIFALIVSIVGVFNLDMYFSVVDESILAGVFTQDLIVLVASIVLLILSFLLDELSIKKLIIIHGILGFYLYAYGIYAIEQIYTFLYPIYLLILSLSFFSLIYSLCNIKKVVLDNINVLNIIVKISGIYAIFIAIMFNFIWFSMLLPLIKHSYRIEYTFSVFIIDLAFIMPALFIGAIMAFRKKVLGLISLPSLFILSFCILFPLALGEMIKPSVFNLDYNMGELALYFTLSVSFIIFAIMELSFMEIDIEDTEYCKN